MQVIAVIFEVWPKPEHKKEYLDLAAGLKPILETAAYCRGDPGLRHDGSRAGAKGQPGHA
jgi:hypothetical protein